MNMQARSISVLAEDSPLIKDIELKLKPDELTALIGPNGAGKTTLLRTLLGGSFNLTQDRSCSTVWMCKNSPP